MNVFGQPRGNLVSPLLPPTYYYERSRGVAKGSYCLIESPFPKYYLRHSRRREGWRMASVNA